jgi:hypothetical protein
MPWTIERKHDHVAVVTMNTNKVNAQNPVFFADLHAAFDRLEAELALPLESARRLAEPQPKTNSKSSFPIYMCQRTCNGSPPNGADDGQQVAAISRQFDGGRREGSGNGHVSVSRCRDQGGRRNRISARAWVVMQLERHRARRAYIRLSRS